MDRKCKEIWYEVTRINDTIQEVEVERETKTSVFVLLSFDGRVRRQAKASEWSRFFPSKKEAKAYLVDRLRREIDGLEDGLHTTRRTLKDLLSGSNDDLQ